MATPAAKLRTEVSAKPATRAAMMGVLHAHRHMDLRQTDKMGLRLFTSALANIFH